MCQCQASQPHPRETPYHPEVAEQWMSQLACSTVGAALESVRVLACCVQPRHASASSSSGAWHRAMPVFTATRGFTSRRLHQEATAWRVRAISRVPSPLRNALLVASLQARDGGFVGSNLGLLVEQHNREEGLSSDGSRLFSQRAELPVLSCHPTADTAPPRGGAASRGEAGDATRTKGRKRAHTQWPSDSAQHVVMILIEVAPYKTHTAAVNNAVCGMPLAEPQPLHRSVPENQRRRARTHTFHTHAIHHLTRLAVCASCFALSDRSLRFAGGSFCVPAAAAGSPSARTRASADSLRPRPHLSAV